MTSRRMCALVGAAVLLSLTSGLASPGTRAAYASSSCTSSSVSAGSGGVDLSIDTSLGCDNANGQAANPSTGYIQVKFPTGVTAAWALLAAEGNQKGSFGGGHPYFTGNYSLNFTNCTGGTAKPDPINSYPVQNIGLAATTTQWYPTPPADNTGTVYSEANAPFFFATNSGSSTITCQYSIVVPGSPDTNIGLASYTVDAWVFFANNAQARTQSVKAPGACTTDCSGFPGGGTQTPELGSGELLAFGLLPVLTVLGYRRRRARRNNERP